MSQPEMTPSNRQPRKKPTRRWSPTIAVRNTMVLIGRLFATVILVSIITGCIGASILTVYVLKYIQGDTDIDLSSLELNYSTILYAQKPDSDEYYELQRIYGM
jgi:penicillin-binding protein 1A